MVKDAALDAIQQFRWALTQHGVHPARIILYGSYVSGNPREDSDIDLVVISEDFSGHGLWERIKMIVPAVRVTRAPIEATALTPEEWEMHQSVVVDFAANGVDV